jgi:toxin ParE1/3/4
MAESKSYRLHPEALQELEAADDWYLQRSLDASAAFIGSALDAFDTISQAPHRWPKYLHGTRRFVLDRFPFSIVYLDDPDAVIIIAVAHSKRRPGYWKSRV